MARRAFSIVSGCLVLAGLTALLTGTTAAQSDYLSENTRLRLSVFQLDPDSGEYGRLDALSGEIIVGAGGSVTIPVLGPVPTAGTTAAELSEDIAKRFQSRMGLRNPPDVMVEVVSYPPIYVVGAVSEPGEFNFRPGMTVLQALALGGGQLRTEATAGKASERIRLLADLQTQQDQIARTSLRVARLTAELDGAQTIDAPAEADTTTLAQEQAVLEAGRTARDRQIASLTDLQSLYKQEIEVLGIRITDLEKTISNTEEELAGVEQLVAGGMATVARRSELERLLSSLRSDRLEQTTAIMRAKQYMTEAERNADGIDDSRKTELTQQLLSEREALEQSRRNADTTRTLLANMDRELLAEGSNATGNAAALTFTIVRAVDGGIVELPVGEAEILLPADVVKVSTGNTPISAVATNE